MKKKEYSLNFDLRLPSSPSRIPLVALPSSHDPSPRRRNPDRSHARIRLSCHTLLTKDRRRNTTGLLVLQFCCSSLNIQRPDAGSSKLTSPEPLNARQPNRDGRGFHGRVRCFGHRDGGRSRRTDSWRFNHPPFPKYESRSWEATPQHLSCAYLF